MPVYYETEIMYRWYKKPDDKTNSKKEQKVKFTSLDKEMLLSCQETIQSVTELYKWLGRKHLPPDYYVVPYDGIRDDALVATMYEELEHYREIKRCYAALKHGEIYEAVHEVATAFLPNETMEQQTQRYIDDGVPDFIAERMDYSDEAVNLLLGKWPQYTNALAAAMVLSCMWKDIERKHDAELQPKYGVTPRDYGKGTAGIFRWWSNSAATDEIKQLLEERRNYILKSLFYYKRKYSDGEQDEGIQSLTRFPGDWMNAISRGERIRVGPEWPNAEAMLDYVLGNLAQVMEDALDDIVNFHLQGVRLQIDSIENRQFLVADTIVDAMYAYLSWDLKRGLSYRKCLCCDTYFVVGNRDRKYCDAHLPPNGRYQRNLIKKKLNEKVHGSN
jgi:hypothetical protein